MPKSPTERQRRQRVDAQRNVGALLEAAKTAFADLRRRRAREGDRGARRTSESARLYRHFPRRSDLVVAVLQREIDACAAAGPALSATHEPVTALTQWLDRYTAFVATKRGLATALHSGDPAFDARLTRNRTPRTR